MTEQRDGGMVDRRVFLGAAGAALAGAAMPTSAAKARRPDRRARNVILAVVDGMSSGCLPIVELAGRAGAGRGSVWLDWMNRPDVRTSLVETTPADGLLTDSAASASCWGIGERINVGALNITPDGRSPAPLFTRAKHAGKRIGLVTTSYLTDATPAAMIANAPSRSERASIAGQMIDRGVDVLIGGGARDFPDSLLNRPDIATARTLDELTEAVSERVRPRLVAPLAERMLPHALDRAPGDASTRDLAAAALSFLSDATDGFCLLVENEHVDEAAHNNDAPSVLRDMIDFENALELLIDFASRRDDTLLIVTTDHACGNPGFSVYREPGVEQFHRLMNASRSFEWITSQLGAMAPDARTPTTVAALVRAATGAELNDDELFFIGRALRNERADAYAMRSRFTSVLSSSLTNHLGVAFTGPRHTTDHVLASAIGPGAERLPPLCHHTDLHGVMARAMGLER